MTRSVKKRLVIIGVVVAALVLVGVGVRLARQPERGSVLEVEIKEEIEEQTRPDFLGQILGGKKLSMKDYVEALRMARDDRRINGLLLVVDDPGTGWAKIQELRDAVQDFQKSGKWAVSYMETAGEFSPGTRAYYLATACG